MDQKKVNVICFQFLQRLFDRRLCFFISCIRNPYFCCDEEFFSWKTAFGKCISNPFFVSVCLCSINAAVSCLNGLQNAFFCLFWRCLINTITKLWHFYPVFQCYILHIISSLIQIQKQFFSFSNYSLHRNQKNVQYQ